MAYNENLTDKVRAALSHLNNVEEKKMFGGIAFMVEGKMCITAKDNTIMCRIDPAIYDVAIKRKGCRPVIMKGSEYKGYVYVDEEGMKAKKNFDYWIALALDFNKISKASPNKKNDLVTGICFS